MPARLTMACGSYDRMEALAQGVGAAGRDRASLPRDTVAPRNLRAHDQDALVRCLRDVLGALFDHAHARNISRSSPSRFSRRACFGTASSSSTEMRVLPHRAISRESASACRSIGRLQACGSAAFCSMSTASTLRASPGRGQHRRTAVGGPRDGFAPDRRVEAGNDRAAAHLERHARTGEIDAYFGARRPAAFEEGRNVVRLFPDYRAREKDFYRRTGFHPIMHTLVDPGGPLRRTSLGSREPLQGVPAIEGLGAETDAFFRHPTQHASMVVRRDCRDGRTHGADLGRTDLKPIGRCSMPSRATW